MLDTMAKFILSKWILFGSAFHFPHPHSLSIIIIRCKSVFWHSLPSLYSRLSVKWLYRYRRYTANKHLSRKSSTQQIFSSSFTLSLSLSGSMWATTMNFSVAYPSVKVANCFIYHDSMKCFVDVFFSVNSFLTSHFDDIS